MKKQLMIVVCALLLSVLSISSARSAQAQRRGGANQLDRSTLIANLFNEQDKLRQRQAARMLAPYVSEPDVKDAFVRSLGTTQDALARRSVVKALALNYAGDRSVQDLLATTVANEQDQLVLMPVINALGSHLDNPNVRHVWLNLLAGNSSELVRLRVSRDLSAAVGDEEIYQAMYNLARRGNGDLVSNHAVKALSARLRDKPELKSLFLDLLNTGSPLIQYQALKGLVELGDPSLKSTLTKKAEEIIIREQQRNQGHGLSSQTLELLRRLDAAETERLRANTGTQH